MGELEILELPSGGARVYPSWREESGSPNPCRDQSTRIKMMSGRSCQDFGIPKSTLIPSDEYFT